MNIRLKPGTEEWLKAQVAEGAFPVDRRRRGGPRERGRAAQEELDAADLSWAKPHIEEGLADVEAER